MKGNAGTLELITEYLIEPSGLYQVFYKETIADDIQAIENSNALQTTKKTLIDTRLGQGKFRKELIKY